MTEPMTLTIITPDAVVYDGKADFLVGRAIALDLAPLRIDNPNGEKHTFAIFGGFVEIEHNKVSIVTPNCESPESIDISRAEKAKARAEGRLSNPTPDIDIERAELALGRALLRLKVTQHL